MKENRQHIQFFLFSQYFSDGVRTTVEIVLPSVIFARFDRLDLGLVMSTGALCASISDGPGLVEHKRNGMMYCILFTFLMTLITGLVNTHVFLMGVLVLLASFFFTMFSVFGNRAASVGTAVLLIMVLRMDKIATPIEVLYDSLLVLAGGCWYLIVALLSFKLYPYRPSQRLLGTCLHETAKYLKIKSAMYEDGSNITDEYRKLVAQQVVVNEKQDELRELLYKNREMMKDPTGTGKLLMVTFADSIDLFENIMASWYDYALLRERFGHTGVLTDVAAIIQNLADETDRIALAIQANSSYAKQYQLLPALEALKVKIDALEDPGNSNLVLKKILVNLRNLGERTDELLNYFKAGTAEKRTIRADEEYARFVSHQVINVNEFLGNFTLQSAVYRHSLRMMITCITGFIIAKFLPNAHHSYWILLTITVILKPGFSLTKQRNLERLFGTIAGGIIGIVCIYFIHDRTVLFFIIVLFMLATYTFIRVNYIVTVIFMTPYIIILFNLLGIGSINVAEERLLDTAIASVLAFTGSYFLFPHWESVQLDSYMTSVLKANQDYLQQLLALFTGNKPSVIDYKLARKQVYISSANLSAAFQRMLSEPKSKQRSSQHVYEFVLLNHLLSSNIASLTASMIAKDAILAGKEVLLPIKKSITILKESLQQFNHQYTEQETPSQKRLTGTENKTDKQLMEQLNFIHKVAWDIGKITTEISKENEQSTALK